MTAAALSLRPTPRPAPGTPERQFCDAMSEDDLQDRVMAVALQGSWHRYHPKPATVRQRGRVVRITHQDGEPGFPDLVLARDGVVLFIELKTEDNSPEPHQRVWLEHLGHRAYVVRPRDLPELRRVLLAPRNGPQAPPPPRRRPRPSRQPVRGVDQYTADHTPVRVVDPTQP